MLVVLFNVSPRKGLRPIFRVSIFLAFFLLFFLSFFFPFSGSLFLSQFLSFFLSAQFQFLLASQLASSYRNQTRGFDGCFQLESLFLRSSKHLFSAAIRVGGATSPTRFPRLRSRPDSELLWSSSPPPLPDSGCHLSRCETAIIEPQLWANPQSPHQSFPVCSLSQGFDKCSHCPPLTDKRCGARCLPGAQPGCSVAVWQPRASR